MAANKGATVTPGRQRLGREPLGHTHDLALPWEEREDRSALLGQGAQDGARDGILDPLVRIAAEIARLDRIGAPLRFDHRHARRHIVEEPRHPRTIERRRHDQQPQIRSQRTRIER